MKVDGIARMSKLMTIKPCEGSIRVTEAEFDDIMKTVDYEMSGYCGFDLVLQRGRTIAYAKGRGADAEIFLHPDYAKEIGYELGMD